MKVRITQSMSGTSVVRNAGDEIELPDEKAVRFCDSGVAVALDQKAYLAAKSRLESRSKRETATVEPQENAANP